MSQSFIQEAEVSLLILAKHLENSGWDVQSEAQQLILHTARGLGFVIRLDVDRRFILFLTYLPMQKAFTDGIELVNRLNRNVFLAGFHIDGDHDLTVSYSMSYEHGLLLPQFSRLIRRFASMLEYVVDSFDDGSVFAFGTAQQLETIDQAPRLLQ